MFYDFETWNPHVDFSKMNRLNKEEIKRLKPEDHLYYVDMNDELYGSVYECRVISTNNHQVTMECVPVIETIIDQIYLAHLIKPHISSFAFVDCCEQTLQFLFKDIKIIGEQYGEG